MGAIEERVAQVEVKVDAFTTGVAELKQMIAALEGKMERRFDTVDRRFDGLEGRFDRRFLWVMGIQFATLLAIIADMFGVLTKLI